VAVFLGLLTVLAGVAVGIVLFATGHVLLGFVACGVAVPVGLVAWMVANERSGR
jgi:hypothetical protein